MGHHIRRISTLLAALFVAPTLAAEHNPVARIPSLDAADANLRVIVKLRPQSAGASPAKLSAAGESRALALSKRAGVRQTRELVISESLVASQLDTGDMSKQEALARLLADSEVVSVSMDRRRYPLATPNDSLFANQWYLQAGQPSAVNAVAAWDRETGRSGVVVAVLDTGVNFDHPDLGRFASGGKLLPGRDFVNASQGNDGDAWDANAADPGDWIDQDDRNTSAFSNCSITNSSWHGTRVAGMIGATTSNGTGVAGLSWNSLILPVRVLGKCGGLDSEIMAGMRWAAGLRVNGTPDNPTPARIINLSLGGDGECSSAYQTVIDELAAQKVLVVVAAGNESTVVASPANCDGVAAVLALRHAGSKVGFSSLGPEVTIGAPGGNCVNVNGGPCLFSLDTTSNNGATSPQSHIYTDQFNSNLGTSFSAPIVSGIAALMVSRNGNLSTAQMLSRLREGATPYPTSVAGEPNLPVCRNPTGPTDFQSEQCLCTAGVCGAGMANAANSVNAADRPIAAVLRPSNVNAGQNVALDGSGSAAACNRTLSTYAWTVVSPTANPPVIVNANSATATVVAPSSGSITLRLTVTDDQGRSDSADVTVSANQASSAAPASAGSAACTPAIGSGDPAPSPSPSPTPSPAPTPTPSPSPSSGGGSGGGGAVDLMTLCLMLLGLLVARRVHRQSRFSRCF